MTPAPHPSRSPRAQGQARPRAARPWRPEAWGGFLAQLIRTEAIGGLLLGVMALVALGWANGSFDDSYIRFWNHHLTWSLLPSTELHSVRDLVNNGIMTAFFLAVGLEIGRERAVGSLRDTRNALLPVAAALGGMAGAAVAYLSVTAASGAGSVVAGGWGVPMATDIALTLAALTALGRRVPSSLRVFVLALAVADDLASVAVLAVVARTHFRLWPFLGALGVVAVTVWLRRRAVRSWPPYLIAVVAAWALLSWAGIEPTLAGAVIGMLVPTRPSATLERTAAPLASYVVLPLFILANTGVVLSRALWRVGAPRQVFDAVVVARIVGKPLGIVVAVAVAVWLGRAELPEGVRWRQLVGAGAMCGIGFTVPLLFAEAAFLPAPALVGSTQVGLLIGSLVAFGLGALTLW